MKTAGILTALGILLLAGAWFYFDYQSKAPEPASNESLFTPKNTMDNKTDAYSSAVKVTLGTSKGEVVLELYPDIAPKTVANFIKLSREGFYNGTKFHRVIPEFMIQGGDPLSKTDPRSAGGFDEASDPRVGSGGPGYQFEDEINPKALGMSDAEIAGLQAEGYTYSTTLQSLPVAVGTIAMANAGPDTNGSQFFIVTVADQPHLNGRHTVFGKVIQGMEVVRGIRQGDIIHSIAIE